MKKHLMIDLETLGTRPGCAILAIGAVLFDEEGVGDGLELKLSVADQLRRGFHRDEATMAWWDTQSEAARQHSLYEDPTRDLPPGEALVRLNRLIREGSNPGELKVWANGASFDLPILEELYRVLSVQVPWRYYNHRCYRTLKAQLGHLVGQPEFNGVRHTALADALYQAAYASKLLKAVYKAEHPAPESQQLTTQARVDGST